MFVGLTEWLHFECDATLVFDHYLNEADLSVIQKYEKSTNIAGIRKWKPQAGRESLNFGLHADDFPAGSHWRNRLGNIGWPLM